MVLARWTAHPARRRPRDVMLVVAVALLTAGAVLGTLQSWFLTALAMAILFASVARFLLPTRYVLTDIGVEERGVIRRRTRAWADLRRLEVGTGAALVSPFARPSWLDRYRGMVLLLDGAERAQVIDLLRARVGAADVAAPSAADDNGAAEPARTPSP